MKVEMVLASERPRSAELRDRSLSVVGGPGIESISIQHRRHCQLARYNRVKKPGYVSEAANHRKRARKREIGVAQW